MTERARFELGAHPAQEVDDLRRLEPAFDLDRLELVGLHAFFVGTVFFDFDARVLLGGAGAGGLEAFFFRGVGGARLVGLVTALVVGLGVFLRVFLFALLGLGGSGFGLARRLGGGGSGLRLRRRRMRDGPARQQRRYQQRNERTP